MYLHRQKKGIIYTQNSAHINGKDYEVDEAKLIFNLGAEEPTLSMIQLWDPLVVKDLRLVKYHLSVKA